MDYQPTTGKTEKNKLPFRAEVINCIVVFRHCPHMVLRVNLVMNEATRYPTATQITTIPRRTITVTMKTKTT